MPLVICGFADAVWVVVIAGFIMGILFDGPMVLWGTLLQRRVPPALLGRIASLDFFVSIAVMPVSMAIAAPVGQSLGLTTTFIVAGLLPVPLAVGCYVAARLWRDETTHPLDGAVVGTVDGIEGTVDGIVGTVDGIEGTVDGKVSSPSNASVPNPRAQTRAGYRAPDSLAEPDRSP